MTHAKTDWLLGHHAVRAALAAGRRALHTLEVTTKNAEVYKPLLTPLPQPPQLRTVEKADLDRRFPNRPHQGVALKAGPLPEVSLEELLPTASLLLVLDQVTDPHNLGAVLRSAGAFGCEGVLLPAHNSAPLTEVVAKAASGALETVPVVTVGNLNRALEALKKENFWITGLAGEGKMPLSECDFSGKTVLVMGSEGKGLRDLVRKNCDFLAHIPISNTVESLNVSVAAGVALYEASKGKLRK